MQGKAIITLAAAASLAAAVLVPVSAVGRVGGMGGHVGGMGAMHTGHFAPGHFAPHMGVHNRFAFNHRFAFRHRFFPRHHFAFVAAPIVGDGCVQVRQVWTPWGWAWRRVWVCY